MRRVKSGQSSNIDSHNGNSSEKSNQGNSNKSSSNLAHIPCKFFRNGTCTAGKNCVFSHSREGPDNYVCKYYLKGNCKFGNKCALSHLSPNDRRGGIGKPVAINKGANGGQGNSRNSNQTEGRSPSTRTPLSYDLNQYSQSPQSPAPPSLNENAGASFSRAATSPTFLPQSPFSQSPFSHLTTGIKSSEYYSSSAPGGLLEEPHRPKLTHMSSSSSHLTIPSPARRGSLPDVFGGFSPPNSDLSSSPFTHPNQISLFLPPVPYSNDNGLLSPAHASSPLRSIPEYLSQYDDDIELGEDDDQYLAGFPSSLNELLTPKELEARYLKEYSYRPRTVTRGFDKRDSLNFYNTRSDPSHVHARDIGRSLPNGMSSGLEANFRHLSSQAPNHTPNHWSGSGSPSISYMQNSNIHGPEDGDYDPPPRVEAINIPAVNNTSGHPGLNSRQNYNTTVKRPSSPDPFSPFLDEETFYMEEVNTESDPQPSVTQAQNWQAPLSYSAIAKTNLKGSGITSGVSIDLRRNEPLCPFVLAGNCRYGDRCNYLHGNPCPSCFKLVLHPYQTEEDHQKHITECMNKQVQVVANDVKPEDIECCICLEKVMSKKDARFGLLNCEHAFCLQCIRHWRSTNTMDNQVIRSCPICRVVSHFITPSAVWIVDRTEKSRIINDYKNNLSTIPCKHFNYGDSQCPFGSSCFYAHMYRDGTKETIKPRTIQTADETKVLPQVKLSDFIDSFDERRMGGSSNAL